MSQSPFEDRTVLVSHSSRNTREVSLTEEALGRRPNYAQLEDRMVFAARIRPELELRVGVNPLVEAASVLLLHQARLSQTPRHQDLTSLKDNLSRDIKTFEYLAMSRGCDNAEVIAGRYVLCTVLDEAVATTPWGEEGEWSRHSLLSSFHNETYGGEKVFQLIDKLSANPARHLDLLELIYLCLSLGFEGKYRLLPRGTLELEAIRDSLYRQIRQLRGDVKKELSPNWQGISKGRPSLVSRVPLWSLLLMAVLCLAVTYNGFNWVLRSQTNDIATLYSPLAQPAVATNNVKEGSDTP
ncbi:type IVB secretion system protein IcmH/DotU [Oceanimonas baumannii]|uniref:type IVB secretion system protein IcmH/DotU n=1 Tax=Oceanimonas baumannii TaxID=129578 RepID=UPI001D19346C|nr:type IVB secretion system protein IcmH/DotU [Oceanimonas baumannii]MCC4265876.1 type IVB secretion system protein IcmH/DotU [Oceanimonas baumannii]